jgi:DNA-binding winged helix-turn-helix (wHTH) protein/tetratricopeptide (TPR) repeat protein
MSEGYEFADFRLDVRERMLVRRGGERVALPDKAFDTLCVLVRNAGRLVEKDELLRSVWADSFVEENNLNKSVHAIRRALGDQNGTPKFIETVKRHGFRFVADVRASHNGNNGPNAKNGNGLHPAEILAAVSMKAAVPTSAERNGLLSRPLFMTVAVIICAAAGFGFYAWFTPVSQAPKQLSILVLPVQPLDGTGNDEILKLGIADATIHRLTGVQGVLVRPLSETRKYAVGAHDPISAGRGQGVDYVLASSYQTADGKFRVTGQLINVSTGRVEETLKSELDLAGKFAMQDAVAGDFSARILKRFDVAPGHAAAKRGTSNEEAYLAYLQGMYLLDKEDPASAHRAIAAFDRAIALDPNYAAAWAGKGHAHCANSHVNASPPDVEFKVAEPSIRRALELDPDNAEAHVVLGLITTEYHWDFEKGERHFRRALEIAPSNDHAHRWYGFTQVRMGRVEEGLAHLREAIYRNPASPHHQFFYGYGLFIGNRLDEAAVHLESAKEMAPEISRPDAVLWQIYHLKGEGARAYETLRRYLGTAPASAEFIGPLESAYRRGGWAAAMSAYIKQRVAKMPEGYWPGHYFTAVLWVYEGDWEQAFKSLEKAVDSRSFDVPYMPFDSALEPLRSDPRFAELVKRSGAK